jgi:Flp pilus assembly protein TadG
MGLRAASRRRRDDGAVAVEFALIFPILALIVFAIIQYGFYFWAMQGGSAAAREAARRAAVGQPTSCTDFENQVQANIAAMETGNVQIARTFDNVPVAVGDDVEVSVSFNSIDMGFPFVPFINDGYVSQTATARVDYLPDETIGNCS